MDGISFLEKLDFYSEAFVFDGKGPKLTVDVTYLFFQYLDSFCLFPTL